MTPSGPRPVTQKQKEAQELIDKFAKDLRALNDGKAIPAQWKNNLLKALTLKPERQKRGRKSDYEKIAAISKAATLERDSLFALDRTKNDKREVIKARISRDTGVGIRRVERIIGKGKKIFEGGKVDKQTMQAIFDGIAAAIGEEITAEHRAEESAKKLQTRRKFPTN